MALMTDFTEAEHGLFGPLSMLVHRDRMNAAIHGDKTKFSDATLRLARFVYSYNVEAAELSSLFDPSTPNVLNHHLHEHPTFGGQLYRSMVEDWQAMKVTGILPPGWCVISIMEED